MRGVNKVILLGTLGRDPETRTFAGGGSITTVSLATSEQWKDKVTGESKEQTEWHRVVFSNRLAEIAAEYLRKGSKVYVEGKLTTRKWTDNQGQEKYSTEIRADTLQLLDGRDGGGQRQDAHNTDKANGYQRQQTARPPTPEDDDLPF